MHAQRCIGNARQGRTLRNVLRLPDKLTSYLSVASLFSIFPSAIPFILGPLILSVVGILLVVDILSIVGVMPSDILSSDIFESEDIIPPDISIFGLFAVVAPQPLMKTQTPNRILDTTVATLKLFIIDTISVQKVNGVREFFDFNSAIPTSTLGRANCPIHGSDATLMQFVSLSYRNLKYKVNF